MSNRGSYSDRRSNMAGGGRRSPARPLLAIALAGLVAGAGAFACTLDLDEALIAAKPKTEGGVTIGDANLPDGTIITESGVPIIPDAAACTKDEECVSANGCLKGRCDFTRRACAYDICHSTACTVGVCDQAAKSCSQPSTYKLKAGELTLDQPSLNVIAAYPWLFQLTSSGVLVYDISNPTKAKPTQIPIVGVGFVPNQFVRSGNRIWIAAPLAGTPARLPLAYIDIPADPFTSKIEAHTVLASYSRPATESIGLVAIDNRGALVIGPAPTFPTALIDTLLAEPATKTATPLVPKENTSPVTISGSRIVMQAAVAGVLVNQFGLITGAGTTNPTTGDLVTIADMGEVSVSRGSAQGLDGATFFVTGVHQAGAGLPGPGIVTKSVRGYLLLKDGQASLDATIKGVDIESYPVDTAPGPNADVVRAATLLDNDTFVVAAAAAENNATATAIQFVKRDLSINKEKRVALATALGTIATLTASDGIVYVAANIPSGLEGVPPTGKVFVIDPACAP